MAINGVYYDHEFNKKNYYRVVAATPCTKLGKKNPDEKNRYDSKKKKQGEKSERKVNQSSFGDIFIRTISDEEIRELEEARVKGRTR